METFEIKGGILEYIDETHTYIYNGIVLPSVTQMLKVKFGNKYDGLPKDVLERAAERGSALHKAIEEYEKHGIESDVPELRNWKFLKRAYKFECIDNEVPIVLFQDGNPVACGRLDLVIKEGDNIGLGDIKRTATLDKEYLAYQLNLYRIAYQQCYGGNIEFLRGVHLRNDIRKYVSLPINEDFAKTIINDYKRSVNNEATVNITFKDGTNESYFDGDFFSYQFKTDLEDKNTEFVKIGDNFIRKCDIARTSATAIMEEAKGETV